MNKLLVITLLIGLLSFGTQGFRMPREAEAEEAVPEEAPEGPAHDEVAPEAPEAPEAHEAHESPEAPDAPDAPAHHEDQTHEEPAEHHGPDATHESEEPQAVGPLTYVTGAIRGAWDKTIDTTTGWIESIKELHLEEKARALYADTTSAAQTYAGILQDQVYHLIYNQ